MNLFIDTNVYLSFYHLTKDDLEELRKLSAVVKEGKVFLFTTQQVEDEFRRNRDKKLQESLKLLEGHTFKLPFPNICKEYPEYETVRASLNTLSKVHAALVNAVSNDIRHNSLSADDVVSELFALASKVKRDSAVLVRARERMEVGNPPGKNRSLGDAINWECMLGAIPSGEDLHLVSVDGDFVSPLDEEQFSSFLLEEYKGRKKASLFFYKRLSSFFSKHFPNIKLASAVESELAVEDLVNSKKFATTHDAVARLKNLADLTPDQVKRIAQAALDNTQVRWLVGDADVKSLLEYLLTNHAGSIDPAVASQLATLLE